LMMLFSITICLISFVIWIIMLIDVIRRDFPNPNDKVLWLIVVILGGIIDAIVYYFVIKRKANKPVQQANP